MPAGEGSGGLRVVVAEDSYLVREGVRRLLESTGEVTVLAAVPTAAELLDAVEAQPPDAVLTDIRMPPDHSTEGIRAAHAIRAAHPAVGVVVLSQHADAGYVLELLQHGADGLGYLLKERIGNRDQLVAALRATARGGSVIDPVLIDALVGRRRLEKASGLAELTDRELDVLRAMAQGLSNAAVAKTLFLSESSIEKYVSTIFTKLGLAEEPQLHRRVAAVVTYLRATGG
jgi:DNA-binding NarL/FixJ family response regulator